MLLRSAGDTALAAELDNVVAGMKAAPGWKRIAAKYGLA
jgi:hypothetical protein